MLLAQTDISDESRLEALAGYDILDTPPEEGFDSIVELATQLCACPVALVSLVDRDRQWFKARVNFPPCETDLSSSVCAHALSRPDALLVIPDLTADARTRANPLVTGEPSIRFYAGAPLVTRDGHVLGTLCVIDNNPRPAGLTKAQADGLGALARQVVTQLDLRRAIRDRDALQARESYRHKLFERLTEGFIVGELVRDAGGSVVDWRYIEVNQAWGELVGIDPHTVIGRTLRDVIPGVEDAWVSEFAQVVETGRPSQFIRQVGTLRRWYEGRALKLDQARFGVLFTEVTERVEADARLTALLSIGDRLRHCLTVGEVTQAAAEIAGRTLGAHRAGFGRILGDVDAVEIEPDWNVPGMASIAGHHRFDDYGNIRTHLQRGEALVINDVVTDLRTRSNPGPMQKIGIAALVNIPVRERGKTVAVFIVHHREPRSWNAAELDFLRNVADRIEASVARIRAEEHQALLNHELSHRMKNTMAMVQAVAIQTLKDASDKDAVAAFTDRIHALASAHDVLLQANWAAAQMRPVIAAVLANFRQMERFGVGGPDLALGPRAVVSLSLLLHELATNAVKYGALSTDAGTVRLNWRVEASPAGDELVLDWTERGGPPVAEPTRKGFGSRLVRLGLVGTGGVVLRYDRSGFSAELRALLAHVQQP